MTETVTILGASFGALIVGALWRRMYGGWLALPRAALLVFACIVFAAGTLALPLHIACWLGPVLMGVIALHFCLGVQFDQFWFCALRYSLGPVALVILFGQWWTLAVGPLIALVYYAGGQSMKFGHNWKISWPWDTATQQMTNGYTTFGELAAGGLSALAFIIAPLVQP